MILENLRWPNASTAMRRQTDAGEPQWSDSLFGGFRRSGESQIESSQRTIPHRFSGTDRKEDEFGRMLLEIRTPAKIQTT